MIVTSGMSTESEKHNSHLSPMYAWAYCLLAVDRLGELCMHDAYGPAAAGRSLTRYICRMSNLAGIG